MDLQLNVIWWRVQHNCQLTTKSGLISCSKMEQINMSVLRHLLYAQIRRCKRPSHLHWRLYLPALEDSVSEL